MAGPLDPETTGTSVSTAPGPGRFLQDVSPSRPGGHVERGLRAARISDGNSRSITDTTRRVSTTHLMAAGAAADSQTAAPVRHHGDLMQPASREQALDAVRAFHAERGRLPRWREWERATLTRPCAKTIERR